MNKRIFLDMDGVILNWQQQYIKYAQEYTSTRVPNNHAVTALSRRDYSHSKYLEKFGKNFWATIPWMLWGRELYDFCRSRCETVFLTAPSSHGSSSHGKMEWFTRNLPSAKYIITTEKYLLANNNSLLIDDNEKKINKFKEYGGITFLFKENGSNLTECYQCINNFTKI